MNRDIRSDGDRYRELLILLNEKIYEYAKKHKVKIHNERELNKYCRNMRKIDLGADVTNALVYGIMHYDVADQRVLKFIDLEDVCFDNICVRRVDFTATNANVDPQTVEGKNIEGANFEGIDMSDKCFDGCVICHANLGNTYAKFNPQNVYEKDLESTNCEGLDLHDADFTGASIRGANFKNAKINLDPQKVFGKSLAGANFENVDMSGKDFSDCDLSWCNLTNTNAVIELKSIDPDCIWGCKLTGTTLLVDENFDREELEKKNVILGTVKFDEYTEIKQKIKTVFDDLR